MSEAHPKRIKERGVNLKPFTLQDHEAGTSLTLIDDEAVLREVLSGDATGICSQ